MKIDNVIFSVNDHPHYQWFWPRVSKIWSLLGVKPILYWVTDKSLEEFLFPSEHGEIRIVPILANDSHQSSMLARIYGCCQEPGVNAIGDIDLFPVSYDFFVTNLKDIREDAIVQMSAELDYLGKYGKLPMGGWIAKNTVFSEMLLQEPTRWNNSVTWDDTFIREFEDYTINLPQYQQMNDEAFIYQKFLKYGYAYQPIHIIPRWGRRLWRETALRDIPKIRIAEYYDLHISPARLETLRLEGEDLFPALDSLLDITAEHLGNQIVKKVYDKVGSYCTFTASTGIKEYRTKELCDFAFQAQSKGYELGIAPRVIRRVSDTSFETDIAETRWLTEYLYPKQDYALFFPELARCLREILKDSPGFAAVDLHRDNLGWYENHLVVTDWT